MTTEKDREWTLRIIDTLTANGVNCGDFNLFILDEEVAELRSETLKDTAARVCASCNAQSVMKIENCEQNCKCRDAVLGKDKE